MAYGLSFSDDFFQTEADCDLLPKDMTDRLPTSVYQALLAMSNKNWDAMARELFHCVGDALDIDTVIARILQTDTCGRLSSPVDVWIDENGYWTIDVFEDIK